MIVLKPCFLPCFVSASVVIGVDRDKKMHSNSDSKKPHEKASIILPHDVLGDWCVMIMMHKTAPVFFFRRLCSSLFLDKPCQWYNLECLLARCSSSCFTHGHDRWKRDPHLKQDCDILPLIVMKKSLKDMLSHFKQEDNNKNDLS